MTKNPTDSDLQGHQPPRCRTGEGANTQTSPPSPAAPSKKAELITVLGVGRMGLPISERLARAGHHLTVFDPDPARRAAARKAGIRTTESVEDAVSTAQLVFTALPGSSEIAGLLDSGMLPNGLSSTATWIDLTSTAPSLARRIAGSAASQGVAILEAPMGGGPSGAATGDLTLYVGGDAAVLQRCRAVLGELASTIHYVGASGTGCLVKHLVNLLWFGQAVMTAEAALLAAASGIGPEQFLHFMHNGPADSRFLQHDFPRVINSDYLPTFGLARIVEELDTVAVEAVGQTSPSRMINAVAEAHREALRQLGPIDGELAVVAHLEAAAGIKLQRH